MHKSGFVNILGKPNVGKSTLMNALVGEKLSIITSKAQTTRHRIFGILNGEDFQIILSDLPGIINPNYKMQASMMSFIRTSLEDADLILYLVEAGDTIANQPKEYEIIKQMEVPVLLLINKIDTKTQVEVKEMLVEYSLDFPAATIMPMSVLQNFNVKETYQWMLDRLPEGPAYYEKDALTDKPERFFMSEIIREKILLNYGQEIPYSCEVVVNSFKEEDKIVRISATIYVNRKSQKPIIIGKNGSMLKKVGTEARIDMEKFLGKQVFLETFVKVLENWRDNDITLRNFGYKE